ncbi:hypothetical protein AYO20_02065 [Fonsecaea nubica]|uniref:C2H2-type domain-containing protein n=1 Tax=Fonsecaea nubica TaxID=856822 RepID=A0A178D9M9_9EURO|nr:hypothetical protein AYO20_02065 [Fonsecaea nubica]OAL38859.1 hypothetical protein AYO20_02065 [Fonsecaea nubica]
MSSTDTFTMFPPGGTRMPRTTGPTTASVKCNICHRLYSRKDVLQRHIRMKHEANTHLKKPKKTRRRSCIRCAVLRVSCSRGSVCDRCAERGLRCQYDFLSEDTSSFSEQISGFGRENDQPVTNRSPRSSRRSPSDRSPETDAGEASFGKTASSQSSHSPPTSRLQTAAAEVRERLAVEEQFNSRAQVWDQNIWTPDWESSQVSVVETLRAMTASPIVDESIISSDEVETYWGIYFSRYHQTLPILHQATLSPTTCSPLLLTTITAIGASYVSTTRAQQYFVTAFGGVCNLSSGVSFRSTPTHGRVRPQEDRWDVITALSLTYHHIVRSCNHGFLGDVLSAQGRVLSWAKHMELLTPEVGERSPGKDIRTHSVGAEDVRQILESQDAMALEDRWLNWSLCEQRKRVTWAIIYLLTFTVALGAALQVLLALRQPTERREPWNQFADPLPRQSMGGAESLTMESAISFHCQPATRSASPRILAPTTTERELGERLHKVQPDYSRVYPGDTPS